MLVNTVFVRAACLLLGLIVAALGGWRADAAEREPDPSYMTDTHGATGVVWAMLSLGEADPKYLECAEQTLAWLEHVKIEDDQGRVTWRLSESAPEGHPHREIYQRDVVFTLLQYFRAYRLTGREQYKKTALAGARWMAEVGADRWETPLGTAYGWAHGPGQKDVGLVTGWTMGLGKFLELFLKASKLSPDPVFRDALTGIVIHLKTRAKDADGGGIYWPHFPWGYIKEKQENVVLTGYCWGQAGVIAPLMQVAREMPDLKLADGTTPLMLGNADLRYLAHAALRQNDGVTWHYMRHDRDARNPGLGSGTSGIGRAFLEGYRANLAAGDTQTASECLGYTRDVCRSAVAIVESARMDGAFRGGGGGSGHGFCGGAGPTMLLPLDLIREDPDVKPEEVERVRRAAKKLAETLIACGRPVKYGLAWPMNDAERAYYGFRSDRPAVNMALDYGQTGVVTTLAESAKGLKDDAILDAARKAADFAIANAVRTEHGWKFARYVGIRE
jgi:hypothetical protein